MYKAGIYIPEEYIKMSLDCLESILNDDEWVTDWAEPDKIKKELKKRIEKRITQY